MNIYNNSTAGASISYPQTSTFSDITTSTIEITTGLNIQNAQKGGLLCCEDNSGNIGQINLGPQNYVFISNLAGSNLPEWSNQINVNDITTNLITYNGTTRGDLLVCEATSNVGRLPIGPSNTVLYSNGLDVGWQSINSSHYFLSVPSLIIGPTYARLYGVATMPTISGRRYRLCFSGQIGLAALTQLDVKLPSEGGAQRLGTYQASGDISMFMIFTSIYTGFLNVEIWAQTTSPTTPSNFTYGLFTLEEF